MSTETRVDRLEKDVGELLAKQFRTEGVRDFGRYADDPVGFMREVLASDPWAVQCRIAEAVRDRPQVTVRSCHAAGKDWLSARLALWWVYARRGLCILTGPTAAQVEEILMRKEIRAAFIAGGLPGELHVRALRVGGDGEASILAKTGASVSAMTGFHGERVLFIITEAQDPEIEHAWTAAFGCTTGAEDRILTVGNPTEPDGPFFKAHRSGSGWHAIRIASTDIPNVQEGRTVVPGLLTREGAERFVREYGAESPVVTSRVHGEFPSEAEDQLIQAAWLARARELWRDGALLDPAMSLVLGCDPARLGPDSSALCIRQGAHVREFVQWRNADTMQSADRVMMEVRRLMGEVGQVSSVYVDLIGLGGGVLDRLKELLPRIVNEAIPQPAAAALAGQSPIRRAPRAIGFDAGKAPGADDEGVQKWSKNRAAARFVNLRAAGYWRLRKALEEGVLALPPNDPLDAELLATRVKFTADGKTLIEKKDDIKKRLGRSPDLADALVISLAPELDDGRPKARFG